METKKSDVMALERFKDKNYGKPGTARRDQLGTGYENFKIGALIHGPGLKKD
jgi:hypothetical protein